MTLPIEAIAYHGWGYDHTCWDGWRDRFVSQGMKFSVFDRGYFGNPIRPPASDTCHTVLLVHSYGLHLCPVDMIQRAHGLVIFSSFLTFHPEPVREKRRSQRVLQRMVDECRQNPEEVLTAFRLNSGDPSPPPSTVSLNRDLLVHDLLDLNTAQLYPNLLQAIPQVFLFHGTGDRIVPMSQGKRLAQSMPQAHVVEIDDAGHALPFTHLSPCWSLLMDHLFDPLKTE